MTSRDFGGAFWEAEVDGVIDMGLRDPWPPDFAHCRKSTQSRQSNY